MLVFSPATQTDFQCVNISISDDLILEDDEAFNILLASGRDRVRLDSPAMVSIMDNDGLSTAVNMHIISITSIHAYTHRSKHPI